MANDGLAPGTVLQDTYRIIRQVGHGGMGAVYEATHARLAGRYAVKVLNPDTAETPEAFQRFRREALVTSGLRHPGIVQVIDFNQAPDGSPYLVMEFLDGVELAQLIAREAPMPLPRVAEIVQQIASALGAAHKQGIIHRDLKPQNVFVLSLDDGRELVKVVDFGISKVQALSLKLTNESALLGTPQYMAPEQVVSKGDLDGRADEFALAAIAYEMLTGRCAFEGETVMSLVYQIVNVEPAPVAAFNATIDAAAERVLRRALAKAPGQRFATIQEFGAALAAAAGLAAMPARPVTPPAPVAAAGSAATPDGGDVRFSTTLQASTGQVRAAAGRASRARIAGGALGVAVIGIAAFAVWRPPLTLRGGASNVVAPATPAPSVAAPVATQPPPPGPAIPAPAPAPAAAAPDPLPRPAAALEPAPARSLATGRTTAKQRPPAMRRRGGNSDRRVADETIKAETPPHRAREVLSDDL